MDGETLSCTLARSSGSVGRSKGEDVEFDERKLRPAPEEGAPLVPSPRRSQFTIRLLLGVMLLTSLAMSVIVSIPPQRRGDVISKLLAISAFVGVSLIVGGAVLLAFSTAEGILNRVFPRRKQARPPDMAYVRKSLRRSILGMIVGGLAALSPLAIFMPEVLPTLVFGLIIALFVCVVPVWACVVGIIVIVTSTQVVAAMYYRWKRWRKRRRRNAAETGRESH
ncbi:MAG: hypothetical protein ACOY3P_21215 [Planctomycetota bacterium]